MGYGYRGACYDTIAEAAEAQCAGEFPKYVARNTGSNMVNAQHLEPTICKGWNASGALRIQSADSLCPSNGQACVLTQFAETTVPSQLVTCSGTYDREISMGDAITLSWLVVAVWVAAFAVRFVARAVTR